MACIQNPATIPTTIRSFASAWTRFSNLLTHICVSPSFANAPRPSEAADDLLLAGKMAPATIHRLHYKSPLIRWWLSYTTGAWWSWATCWLGLLFKWEMGFCSRSACFRSHGSSAIRSRFSNCYQCHTGCTHKYYVNGLFDGALATQLNTISDDWIIMSVTTDKNPISSNLANEMVPQKR